MYVCTRWFRSGFDSQSFAPKSILPFLPKFSTLSFTTIFFCVSLSSFFFVFLCMCQVHIEILSNNLTYTCMIYKREARAFRLFFSNFVLFFLLYEFADAFTFLLLCYRLAAVLFLLPLIYLHRQSVPARHCVFPTSSHAPSVCACLFSNCNSGVRTYHAVPNRSFKL